MINQKPTTQDPHGQAQVLHYGAPLEEATAVVILIHGRGASAQSILQLAPALVDGLDIADNVAFLAPQATNNTWYPHRFIAPLEMNQPWLDSALGMIDQVVDAVAEAGHEPKAVMVAGFSQGACLSVEYAARASRPIGAVAAWSGGLIGPVDEPHMPLGDVAGMPVFLGTGTIDDHVQPEQVRESARLFEEAGAKVDVRIYDGMTHTINDDEIAAVREMIKALPKN
jgi:phospholipase/carboxylesterase